jgi:branched-chain amino acid transport system substrate-binding protein
MRRQRGFESLALGMVLLLVASCSTGGSSGGGSGPIVFAAVGSFTGIGAGGNGAANREGSLTGAKVINDAGGILGRALKLDFVDTVGDPADAVPATNKELLNGPVAFNGPNTSDFPGVQPIIDRNHIVDGLQAGSTVFDSNTDKWVYRCNASDSQLGVAMALLAHEKGYKKAAVFFDNNPSTETLIPLVEGAFKALGGSMGAVEIVTDDQTSYRSEIQNIINSNPDVIFTAGDGPTAAVEFNEFRQLDNLAIPFIASDEGSNYVKAVGPATTKQHLIFLQGSDALTASSTAFQTAYLAMNGHQPISGAVFAYDCMILFALAITKAGNADPNVWVNDITAVTNDETGTVVSDYKQAVDLIKAGKTIDYEGASGPMDFNKYHNVSGAWDVVTASGLPDGSTTTLETITAAQTQAFYDQYGSQLSASPTG